jgi:hypothetical protein
LNNDLKNISGSFSGLSNLQTALSNIGDFKDTKNIVTILDSLTTYQKDINNANLA